MKTYKLVFFLVSVALTVVSCGDDVRRFQHPVVPLAKDSSGRIAANEMKTTLIFNGTNLDGWVKINGGTFTATNGILHLEGGNGWLRTEKEFGDFVMEAEWRGLETNYNSGIFVRTPLDGRPWPTNEWQVNTKQSAIDELLHGSVKTVKSVTPPVSVGEWVAFRIEARGTNLSLDVNGQRAWEFHELNPARGYIGLQAEGKSFDFRNLRIREIFTDQPK
jgi:hypothetical protein